MKKIEYIIIVSLLVLSGCSTCMFVEFDRPPEIDLRGYKTIAMGDITDINDSWISIESLDIGDEIEQRLFHGKRFDVLDRQHIRALLEERYLMSNQRVGEGISAKLKDIIGAGGFIFGRIKKNEYKEITSKGKPWKDYEKKTHIDYFIEGTYTYEIYLKVVDCLTSKVVATKSLKSQKYIKKSETDKWPEEIDKEELYNLCYKEVAENFMKVIQPYKVFKEICFESDSDVPEIEKALDLFDKGQLEAGVILLKKALNKGKNLYLESKAKIHYNIGLARLAQSNFYESVENFIAATYLVPEETKYHEALSQAEFEREQYIKTQESFESKYKSKDRK